MDQPYPDSRTPHQPWWRLQGWVASLRQGWGEEGRARLWLVVSAVSFSLMALCVKQVRDTLPPAEVVLARGLVSLVLSWWMVRRARLNPWGQRRGLLVLRGVLGSTALLCLYGALGRLPLADATVLQYFYPALTAVMAWLWLGERPGGRLLVALALGWLGVLLIAQPPVPGSWVGLKHLAAAGSSDGVGVALAVAGALFTALAYVSVRQLGSSEHPLVIVFYFPLVAVVCSLPLVLLHAVWPTAGDLPWLLGVGVFTQLGQLGLTAGLTRLPAAQATTISTVQVPVAALWGWWLFGEVPGAGTLLGAGLIFASALLSLRRPRRAGPEPPAAAVPAGHPPLGPSLSPPAAAGADPPAEAVDR